MKIDDINIVKINDVEDIVLAKLQIDKDDPDVEERSDLNEFIKKYCILTDSIYIDEMTLLVYNYKEIFGKKYLFVTDCDYAEKVIKYVKDLDFDNLKQASHVEMLNNTNKRPILNHNGKYYIL